MASIPIFDLENRFCNCNRERKSDGRRRVRSTFNGFHAQYEGNVKARLANQEAKKAVMNAYVSGRRMGLGRLHLAALDIKDFYLNRAYKLDECEYAFSAHYPKGTSRKEDGRDL